MGNTAFLQALEARKQGKPITLDEAPKTIEQKVSDLAKKATQSATFTIAPSNPIPISDLIPNQVCTNPDVINGVQTFATPLSETKPHIIVERVINKHRIDLFFNSKPDDVTLAALHKNGWHYRPSDKAWYHKDATEQHVFLELELGIVIEEKKLEEPPIADSFTQNTEELPEYTEFKRQVNVLVEHLKVSPADLMLLAIQALYEKHQASIN